MFHCDIHLVREEKVVIKKWHQIIIQQDVIQLELIMAGPENESPYTALGYHIAYERATLESNFCTFLV